MTATKQHKKVILVGDGAVEFILRFRLLTKELHKELGIIEIPQLHEKAVGIHFTKRSKLNTLTVQTLTLLLSPQVPSKTR